MSASTTRPSVPDDLMRNIQAKRQRASEVSAFLKRWSEASGRFIRATEELHQSATLLGGLLEENRALFMAPPASPPPTPAASTTANPSPAARLAAETMSAGTLPPPSIRLHPPTTGTGWTSSSSSSSSSSPRDSTDSERRGGSTIEEPDPEKLLTDLVDRFGGLAKVSLTPVLNLVNPFVSLSKNIQNSLCNMLALVEDGERAYAKIHHSLDKAEKKVKECAQKGASSYQKLIDLEQDRDQLSETVKSTGDVILASSDITLNVVLFHMVQALATFMTGIDELSAHIGGALTDNSTAAYCRSTAQLAGEELARQHTKVSLAQNALRDPRKPLKQLKMLQRESRRGAQWSRMKQSNLQKPRMAQIGTSRDRQLATLSVRGSTDSDGKSTTVASSSTTTTTTTTTTSPAIGRRSSSSADDGVDVLVDSDDDDDDDDVDGDDGDDDDEEWLAVGGGGGVEDEAVVRVGCWSFEVEKVCRRKTKRKTLVLDAGARSISLYDVTRQTTRVLPAGRLMAIRRSNVNARKVKLFWQSRATPERFLFYTKERVERFHEAYWALRGSSVGQPSKPLTVFVGTWNMGNAPAPESLSPWLPAEPDCDVYMISVQECEYSPRGGQSNEDDWFNQVVQHFGDRYYRLVGLSLLHIRTLVLIKREHYGFVSHLKRATVATGIANVIGNKGGTGVCFSIYGTRLCFIGAHLAAHQERLSDRNQNYRDIMRGLAGLVPDDWELTTLAHHLFFTGDLNYRIDLPRDEVIQHIDNRSWLALLKADQLSHQLAKQAAFAGFHEGPLSFQPTYRYNRGDRTWSVEKMRVPSWCDRVLWKSLPGCPAELLSYNCCNAITTSDHSPVAAVFRLHVPLPVPKLPSATGLVPAAPERQCCLRFYAFRAQLHPKGSGRAEPYVYIAGDFLDSSVTSASVSGTIMPSWNPDGIPSLIPIISDVEFLRRQHLLVAVRDKQGDPFGQCALSLADLCAAANPSLPVAFSSPIWRGGLITGDVSGSLALLELGSGGTATDVFKEGYLLKQGEVVKNWKRRWFVLKKSGTLEYFDNETDPKPINALSVVGRTVRLDTDSGKLNCISIEMPKRNFRICADSPAARNEWLSALLEFTTLSQSSPSTAVADRMSHRASTREN